MQKHKLIENVLNKLIYLSENSQQFTLQATTIPELSDGKKQEVTPNRIHFPSSKFSFQLLFSGVSLSFRLCVYFSFLFSFASTKPVGKSKTEIFVNETYVLF